MFQYIRAEAVIDLNAAAATVAFTAEMPFAGRLIVNKSWARVEEAIGTMATTVGVGSIKVAGTEVATLTPTPEDAIGEAYKAVPDGTVALASESGVVQFSAGDDIAVLTKTQAVDAGGTVTGTLRVYLCVEFGD